MIPHIENSRKRKLTFDRKCISDCLGRRDGHGEEEEIIREQKKAWE